jgi:hypothetical protein
MTLISTPFRAEVYLPEGLAIEIFRLGAIEIDILAFFCFAPSLKGAKKMSILLDQLRHHLGLGFTCQKGWQSKSLELGSRNNSKNDTPLL